MTKKLKPPENLWIRLLLFSFFILIINSWSLHHLGNKLRHILIANGPLALIAIVNFFSQILLEQEVQEFKEKIRGWFFYFLKTPVLIILFGLILVAGSVVSSVTVMSGGVSDTMTANLTPEGKSQSKKLSKVLDGPDDVERFISLTTPFGRPFYLEVERHLRYSFDLYPWIGKKIRVSKDLNISPSILIRVPFPIIRTLRQGKIVVASDNAVIAEVNTKENQGSIIVGHYFLIPSEFVDKWKMELLAMNITGAPAAGSLLAWQQAQLVPPNMPLVPGIIMEAKYFIVKEKPLAVAKFMVGSEKIQDILLSISKEEIP